MKEITRGTYMIDSEAETRALGLRIASAAEPGDIIALVGDLGTGKTALTKYIAEGLGVTEEVISPTFNIVKEYRSGRIPLFHFDVYRLSGSEEFLDTGAEDYLEDSGLSVIEWADIVADALPEDSLLINIEYAGKGERRITVL
jgi:tRNA threonylcarbamoyladenosine biosynthesis protein TsaE